MKLTSKSFMLHEKNYDHRMSFIHTTYGSTPKAIHCTPSRYILFPVRAEGEHAIDLVLDFDGKDYEENLQVANQVKEYFLTHELKSFQMWRTNGKHNGIQMIVPFECFVDKTDITTNDLIKIKRFYIQLNWILNRVITKANIIELKDGHTTFRVPLTFNEVTERYCNILYDGGDTEYLSGEDLYSRILQIASDPYYWKQMLKEVKLPRLYRNRVQKKVAVKFNSINPDQFPPCFKTGMFTMVKKNTNRELIIFATWCFLKHLGWDDSTIIRYLKRWKDACRVGDEMNFDIEEKHKGRRLTPVSCQFIINKAKFCPLRCTKRSPSDGLV